MGGAFRVSYGMGLFNRGDMLCRNMSSTESETDEPLQWDRALSSLVIRSGLGFSFGVIFSVLLFKRRAWPVWLGTGFGAGRAWEEADGIFYTSQIIANSGS
jgi:hypothetical protein